MRKFTCRMIGICLILLPFAASHAADTIEIKLSLEPNVQNGRDIYETCAACHLPEGWGNTDGTYPQIAGQHRNVLIKQLLDIRNGKRENPTMYPFVQERTIGGYQALADVVVYVSTLPMHPKHQKGPWEQGSEDYRRGEILYKQHCTGCHGETASGSNDTITPKLYGQHYPYLIRQIAQIRSGLREVSPAMKTIVDTLPEAELERVVNYISHIPVPEKERAPSLDWRNTDFY